MLDKLARHCRPLPFPSILDGKDFLDLQLVWCSGQSDALKCSLCKIDFSGDVDSITRRGLTEEDDSILRIEDDPRWSNSPSRRVIGNENSQNRIPLHSLAELLQKVPRSREGCIEWEFFDVDFGKLEHESLRDVDRLIGFESSSWDY